MAISAAVGLVTGIGAAIAVPIIFAGATITAFGFATAFAIGAGFSALSRALIPKPDLGAQMRGTTVTTRDPAGPRKLIYGRVRAGGNTVFIDHSGSDNKYLHLVVVFASHEIQAYDEIWFNDNKIWTASGGFQEDWGTYVTIDRKFGTAGQAASSSLVSASSYWTNDHKLSGIAYIAFRLEWNQDKFPQGVPNITAVIRGKKVYDPRTQVIAYSQNPALCVRDYLLDSSYGLGESSSSINYDALEAAADLCEEQVALAAGGTQDRYQCNGIIETSNQIKSNIEQLLSSMGGKLTYSGGEYFIDGAEYRAPSITIDESVIISSIKTKTKQSRRSIYNGVKGTFISEEKNYKVLDYPSQISSTYATEDGDPIFLDMPLPFVSNNLQAQRLAKIALLKSRQQTVISMTVNLAGLKIKIGDTISVNYDKLGYSGKVFEVIGYELAMSSSGEMGVQLECIETAAAVYDWTTSDEQDFLSGGELDLYDGRTVDNVTSLAKSEIGLLGPDGSVSTSVELTWTAPDDAFIDFYKIRYNKNGTTDYFHAETKEPRILLSGLDVNSNYDFRVQVQNLLGVTSTGTTLSDQALSGDTTAPSVPASVSATGGIQTITCEWDKGSDDDYAFTEVHVVDSDSEPAGAATPTAKVAGEEYVVTGLSGAVTKHFFLRNVDFSGNKSAYTDGVSGTSVVAASADIGSGAVGSGQIEDGAVGTSELGDNSVTITKIADTLESTNYVAGTSGWKLTTDGTFEAGDGTFRGALTATSGSIAGTVTIGSTAASTVESGAAAGATALQNGDSITSGAVGPVTITSTQLYQGAGNFNNADTGFYLDNTGDFSLIDKLVFDASASTLSVDGNIVARDLNITNATVTGNLSADNISIDGVTLAVSSGNLIVADGGIGDTQISSIDGSVTTISNLQANNIVGDVSEHFNFALGQGIGATSMKSLSSTKQTFDVEIPAPTGGVAKRAYIQGVAIADTNDVTGFDFTLEIRLKAGKSYTHDFTGYDRAATAPYGTSSINYNIYSGNQITDLALGGVWTDYSSNVVSVHGFFYDESADETYLLFNDDQGDFQNGDWALTPSSSTTAASNLCLPKFGAPANGEEHTVPFIIILPETTVATTFMITFTGSGFLRGLNGEAGYMR